MASATSANRGSRRALAFLLAGSGGQGVRAEWAVQGLGLSGVPSLEVVNQALTDHAFIRHHGLRAYYDR